MSEITTPIAVINEIFEKNYSASREEIKKKYGEQVEADVQKVYEAVMAIPWYGSASYDNNKNSFSADCEYLFPGISEEAINKLHFAYAASWIP